MIAIGVSPSGRWFLTDARCGQLSARTVGDGGQPVCLIPAPTGGELIALGDSPARQLPQIDVVLPLIHGPHGEDGTLQGLLELSELPYVGSGVLGSALCMDKAMMKTVLERQGLNLASYRTFSAERWHAEPVAVQKTCEAAFAYPWFVKPASMGSSIGVTKVRDLTQFTDAMELATCFDSKVVVEAAIAGAREVEVGVLGNLHPQTSVAGEIVPAGEFYDYAAKYHDDSTQLKIPAALPEPISERLRCAALKAFKSLDCAGLARVDFLVRSSDLKIFVSEVNTLPGFTATSMFPKLWSATGVSYSELIDRLVSLAEERSARRQKHQTRYSWSAVRSSAA